MILPILDSLTVPKTFDELINQIQSRDCYMFHPMMGLPRAYMEIPVWEGKYVTEGGQERPDVSVERWVYRILNWWARGARSRAEALLCRVVWKAFIDMRRQFALFYGEMDPLLVWRRRPEFEERLVADGEAPCFEHDRSHCTECVTGPICCVNMRLCVPGLMIERSPHAWYEGSSRLDPRWEVKEVVV